MQRVANSRIQLEIWRTAAEIAATDPDVVVRSARTTTPDSGLLLEKPSGPGTRITLTAHRGVRVSRDGTTTSWSWSRVLGREPISFSATVIDAAMWAQNSGPVSTSASAAGALAIAEILNLISSGGAAQAFNRYAWMDEASRPYLAPLPPFPSVRDAVREQARMTVDFGAHVALDRWWFITYYGTDFAAVDLEAGVLHQADRADQLPVGLGMDGRKAIRSLVMDLIRRQC